MAFTFLRSLSARVVAMTIAGIMLVSVVDLVGTGMGMRVDAARRAVEQQEIDLRVAWHVLHAYGLPRR